MSRFKKSKKTDNDFTEIAIRVSRNSILANIFLTVVKFLAGILFSSGAMVSDAIHSASDVVSSFIVIIGVKIASKDSDEDHPFGHDRFESVAAIVLSAILAVTGFVIGYHAFIKLVFERDSIVTIPGVPALVAAVVSILVKEIMFWYTKINAKLINSGALIADAWHHRSDALSSIGSLIGIAGARMGYAWFDPLASIVICGFILHAAYEIFSDAIDQLVDKAGEPELENRIVLCALSQPDVMDISRIRTRKFGNKVYVELEVCADGTITLEDSFIISQKVHEALEKQFPEIKHVMVRVNPDTIGKYLV